MISVVMSAYNNGNFIGQAIESILNQTFQQFELIIVDDGSSDDTVSIVKKYQEQDDRIRLIQNNRGERCVARNTGIEAAKYEWIAPLDDDDIALPQRLEKQYQAAQENPEVAVWGCYMMQIDDEGTPRSQMRNGPTSVEAFNAIDRTETYVSLYNSAAFFRREHALAVGGYDTDLIGVEDSELWDRMTKFGPIVVIPEVLIHYRFHAQNNSTRQFFKGKMIQGYVTARNKAQAEGKTLSVEEYKRQYNQIPIWERVLRDLRFRSMLYYRLGSVQLLRKDYPRALWYTILSIIAHPVWSLGRIWYRLTHNKSADEHWQGV